MKRVLVSLFAVALLGACAPKEVVYKVHIVKEVCDSSLNPFDGVSYLRVRVTGDGIATPLDAVSVKDAPTQELTIPSVPSGARRVIDVRAYDGDPASGGHVLSMGRSLPFDVPDVVPDDLNGQPVLVNIFLRKVNAFTPPSSANAPSQCQRMRTARAGHTATLLKNGKVFIAGGFNLKPGSPEKVALADAELYNPATGAFEETRPISINQGTLKLPKAFHTATRLPSGQVLLWGGEAYGNVSGANNVVIPNTVILIYDPDVDPSSPDWSYGALGQRADPIARTQHSAALDMNGKVLVAGGLTRTGGYLTPTDKVEWFDPADNSYKVIDNVTLPRVGASMAPVKGGEFIAVAGGTNFASLQTDVVFFKYDGSTYRQQALANAPRLADPGRRSAGVATLRDGSDLLLVGGFSDVSSATAPPPLSPVASSEIVSTASASVIAGPTLTGARGEVCTVTLPDGSVMGIGGRTTVGPGGPAKSDGATIVIRTEGGGGVVGLGGPSLTTPRWAHSCTTLADGSVLVLGGINESTNGATDILQDAWIFQPAPTD